MTTGLVLQAPSFGPQAEANAMSNGNSSNTSDAQAELSLALGVDASINDFVGPRPPLYRLNTKDSLSTYVNLQLMRMNVIKKAKARPPAILLL